MSQKQKGFAALETILIIVIVAVISGIGWYALHTKHQTDKILSQADKISQSVPVQSNKSAPSSKSSAGQKYLVIKEWGVRIPYSSSDTYSYVYRTDTPTIIDVISKNLSDKFGCTQFGAGEIGKAQGSDPSAPDESSESVAQYDKENPGRFVHIGNYYYAFVHDQASCSETVTLEAQNAANDEMSKLVLNMQATPQ